MKAVVLKNWNIMRILRLGIGIFVIWQGVLVQEWALIIVGSLFLVFTALNISCCGTHACKTQTTKKNIVADEITYEEVR